VIVKLYKSEILPNFSKRAIGNSERWEKLFDTPDDTLFWATY
jgi:hypothetical protein